MNAGARIPLWRAYVNSVIASDISGMTRYFDCLIQWLPRPDDRGLLFEGIECPEKQLLTADEPFPDLSHEVDRRSAVLLNAVFNHNLDIQGVLTGIRPRLSRSARIVSVLYNPYLAGLFRWATRLGIRHGPEPCTFITCIVLNDIARLSGFEVVRARPMVYFPWSLFGIGHLLNRVIARVPLLRWSGLVSVVVLRPVGRGDERRPSLTIIIPARNERGNITNVLSRLPDLGAPIEAVFVEGHSSDGTWDEIQRVTATYVGPVRVKGLRQPGRGKNDAVRHGIAHATGELIIILDADLTMPPEMLGRFYEAYRAGHADFVNGNRLAYPMEGEAMRWLNRLGNLFFARSLGALLDASLGDTLCGTKLFTRHDHDRFMRWRNDFGAFDPFGDFELLIPAARLGLGIIDVPVYYRRRTYGVSNIRRFRDGFRLVQMLFVGLIRF
jgi:hypothetical protein